MIGINMIGKKGPVQSHHKHTLTHLKLQQGFKKKTQYPHVSS